MPTGTRQCGPFRCVYMPSLACRSTVFSRGLYVQIRAKAPSRCRTIASAQRASIPRMVSLCVNAPPNLGVQFCKMRAFGGIRLGLFQIGHIVVYADPFPDAAVRAAQGDRPHPHVAVHAVLAAQTVFGLEYGLIGKSDLPGRLSMRALVGMNHAEPPPPAQFFKRLARERAP